MAIKLLIKLQKSRELNQKVIQKKITNEEVNIGIDGENLENDIRL